MPKFNILIARFPFGNSEVPDAGDWLVETVLAMKKDPQVGDIFPRRYDDTPITMTRNRCLYEAQSLGADYVLMLDSDMKPDLPGDGAKPFWASSWAFAMANRRPCVIAAPYCGPPPHENVYVFRWARRQSDHPDVDMTLEQYTREEAGRRGGMEEVGALPTGLILIDTRVLDRLGPEYFYYEYTDQRRTHKASTEDVTFTRDVSLAGYQVFCNWDAWAGHWKRKCVGKPAELTIDTVRQNLVNAVRSNWQSNQRVVETNPHGLSLEERFPGLADHMPGRRVGLTELIYGGGVHEADEQPISIDGPSQLNLPEIARAAIPGEINRHDEQPHQETIEHIRNIRARREAEAEAERNSDKLAPWLEKPGGGK